jgi:hypothetical protein
MYMVIHKTRKKSNKKRRKRRTKKYIGGSSKLSSAKYLIKMHTKIKKDKMKIDKKAAINAINDWAKLVKKEKLDQKFPDPISLMTYIKMNIPILKILFENTLKNETKKELNIETLWKKITEKDAEILKEIIKEHESIIGSKIKDIKSKVDQGMKLNELKEKFIYEISPIEKTAIKKWATKINWKQIGFPKLEKEVSPEMKEEILFGKKSNHSNFLLPYIKYLLKTSQKGKNDEIENRSGELFYKLHIGKNGIFKLNTQGAAKHINDYNISSVFDNKKFISWGGKRKSRRTKKKKRRRKKR